MSTRLEVLKHPEFTVGAQNCLLGHSKSKSQAHLTKADHDAREANREGWNAMSEFLLLTAIRDSMMPQR